MCKFTTFSGDADSIRSLGPRFHMHVRRSCYRKNNFIWISVPFTLLCKQALCNTAVDSSLWPCFFSPVWILEKVQPLFLLCSSWGSHVELNKLYSMIYYPFRLVILAPKPLNAGYQTVKNSQEGCLTTFLLLPIIIAYRQKELPNSTLTMFGQN